MRVTIKQSDGIAQVCELLSEPSVMAMMVVTSGLNEGERLELSVAVEEVEGDQARVVVRGEDGEPERCERVGAAGEVLVRLLHSLFGVTGIDYGGRPVRIPPRFREPLPDLALRMLTLVATAE